MNRAVIAIVALILGLTMGVAGARLTESEVFHPNGVVRKERARINYVTRIEPFKQFTLATNIGSFSGDRGLMESRLYDLLVREQQDWDISIPVMITYVVPTAGSQVISNIDLLD